MIIKDALESTSLWSMVQDARAHYYKQQDRFVCRNQTMPISRHMLKHRKHCMPGKLEWPH